MLASDNFREFHNFIFQVDVGNVQQDAIASEQVIGTDANQYLSEIFGAMVL